MAHSPWASAAEAVVHGHPMPARVRNHTAAHRNIRYERVPRKRPGRTGRRIAWDNGARPLHSAAGGVLHAQVLKGHESLDEGGVITT